MFQVRSGNTPANGDALPTFRVYGPNGLMQNGTGTASFRDSGSITNASNASPIVITSAAHGLSTGTRVTITGVGGNTAANGSFIITVVDANSFSLNGSSGNGAYTSGGTWNVSGLYKATISCVAADGYEAGESYTLLASTAISGTAYADILTFIVT